MRTSPVAVLLIVARFASGLQAAALEPVDPSEVLTGDGVYSHLELLADDALEGRGAGTRGGAVAAAYAARHFENLGLQPAGLDGSFFQPFVLGTGDVDKTTRLVVLAGEHEIEFRAEDEGVAFVPLPGCRAGKVKAAAVFAGYGITAPELGYDDYAGVDVKGKVVLILRHEPGEDDDTSPFDGKQNTKHAFFETKVANAIAHGAVAVILVTDPANHENTSPGRGRFAPPGREADPAEPRTPGAVSEDQQRVVGAFGLERQLATLHKLDGQAKASGIPAVHVELQVAEALFARQPETLLELQQQIDSELAPRSRALNVVVDLDLVMGSGIGRNVCALLPGHDPVQGEEVIVLGAHLDHLGIERGQIHNGADDNASGSSGLLAVAEAFARCPIPPRRSILFLLFDGEESGLLGSRYYSDFPTIPLEHMQAMVNIDMIGRNPDRPIDVVGAPSGQGLVEVVTAAAAEVGVEIKATLDDTFMRSDQYSFYQHGVPVVFYTTGEHPQYHKPDDDAPLISHQRLQDLTRLVFVTIAKLARLESRLAFVNIDADVTRALAAAQGPRLGLRPRPVGEEESASTGVEPGTGLFVIEVVPGSAAARAGVEAGDVVLAIDSAPLAGKGRSEIFLGLRKILAAVAGNGKPVQMVIVRKREQLTLTLDLGAKGG